MQNNGELYNYREESKKQWHCKGAGVDNNGNRVVSEEQIHLGATLRIADAMEQIAVNYKELIEERNYLQIRNKALRDELTAVRAKLKAQKGVVTRIKNKAKSQS